MAASMPLSGPPSVNQARLLRQHTPTSLYVVVGALTAALFFSAFSPLSEMFYGTAAVITAVRLLRGTMLKWFGAMALTFSLWWLFLGAVIGALPPIGQSLVFLSDEGRILLAGVPLVLIATCDRFEARDVALWAFRLLGIGALALASIWLVSPALIGPTRWGLLSGFTSSHHVPGFLFSATLIVASLWAPLFARPLLRWSVVVASLTLVALSQSRASIVGLVLAGVATVLIKNVLPYHRRVLWSVPFVLIVILATVTVPRIRETVNSLLAPEFREATTIALETGDERVARSLARSEQEANVLTRAAFFGQAAELWAASPVIGAGPFRFNDENATQVGIRGLLYPVIDAEKTYGTVQSHNMILHLLAEGGLVGAGLFLVPLCLMVLRLRRDLVLSSESHSMSGSAIALFVFALGASLSSLALLTPAMAVPVLLFVGAAYTLSKDTQLRPVYTQLGERSPA